MFKEIKSIAKQEIFDNKDSKMTGLARKEIIKEIITMNDPSIKVVFINREEWNKKGLNNILEKKDKKKVIHLPEDLHYYEAHLIAQVLDIDTYGKKNEKANIAKERMEKLAQAFQYSAISLSKIIDDLRFVSTKKNRTDENKEKVKNLAKEIIQLHYAYGKAMLSKSHKIDIDKIDIESLKEKELSEEQQKIADIFFTDGQAAFDDKASSPVYDKREKKIKRKIEIKQKILKSKSKDLLKKFFKLVKYSVNEKNSQSMTDEQIKKKRTKEEVEKLRKEISSVWLSALLKKGYEMDEEDRERRNKQGENIPVYERKIGPFRKLQEKTKEAMKLSLKEPEAELINASFRRGAEYLKKEMKFDKLLNILDDLLKKQKEAPAELTEIDKHNIRSIQQLEEKIKEWQKQGYETFYQALEIEEKAKELKKLREKEDKNAIAKKELEIVDEIQEIIQYIPYKSSIFNPAEMTELQYKDCVGVSFLASSFFKDLNINHLLANTKDHAFLLIATEDNQVYWRDMLSNKNNKNLNEINFKEKDISKKIIEFLEHPKGKTLSFNLQDEEYLNFYKSQITLSDIDEGLRFWVMNNKKLYGKDNFVKMVRLVEINPNDANAYYNLGVAYVENNQPDKAIEAYQKAIEIDSDDIDAYNNLGIVYEQNNQLDKAIEIYKKAIEIDSDNVIMYRNLGIVYEQNNQLNKAIEAYRKYIKLNPGDASMHYNLGIVYEQNNQLDKAIEEFMKAGRIFVQYNSLIKADIAFISVLDIDPQNVDAYYELYSTFKKQGKTKEAQEMLDIYNELKEQ